MGAEHIATGDRVDKGISPSAVESVEPDVIGSSNRNALRLGGEHYGFLPVSSINVLPQVRQRLYESKQKRLKQSILEIGMIQPVTVNAFPDSDQTADYVRGIFRALHGGQEPIIDEVIEDGLTSLVIEYSRPEDEIDIQQLMMEALAHTRGLHFAGSNQPEITAEVHEDTQLALVEIQNQTALEEDVDDLIEPLDMPLIITQSTDGWFYLAGAGHRRIDAVRSFTPADILEYARRHGINGVNPYVKPNILANIYREMSPEEMLKRQIAENTYDPPPHHDVSMALRQCYEILAKEAELAGLSLSYAAYARTVGLSPDYVARALAYTELPAAAKEMVRQDLHPYTYILKFVPYARGLRELGFDDIEVQAKVLDFIAIAEAQGWSTRKLAKKLEGSLDTLKNGEACLWGDPFAQMEEDANHANAVRARKAVNAQLLTRRFLAHHNPNTVSGKKGRQEVIEGLAATLATLRTADSETYEQLLKQVDEV